MVQLAIVLGADRLEKVDLRLQKVDMAFLVLDQLLEQHLAGIVADGVAMVARLDVQRARVMFCGQIAVQRLAQVLSDSQRVQPLQVGMTLQKDDPLDQLVGVFISSMDSARDLAAILPKPQSSCRR